ncbi:MAG TPA: NAD(P)H-hydrate dehydratase [Candidatus Acidoferrales bacterium]|nr:NAD(P)H-hydrate dehydratase [Candidatus Acidoferrales bacterium]
MLRVVTAGGMRALDAAASAEYSDIELMRRAGRAIASVARRLRPGGRVIALAGYGNNGGDAFAALAELDGAVYERIALAFDPGERQSAARRDALARARAAGVSILTVGRDADASFISGPHLYLDGLLGVGARGGMSDEIRRLTRALNEGAQGGIIALDVPTGVDATTGIAEPDAVKACATVTLGALKLGLLLETGRPYVGELWFDDIGIGGEFDQTVPTEYVALDDRTAVSLLPRRAADGDKRQSGAPLVLAGSEQFPGAAVLCARAAGRAGAGYVTVATPRRAATAIRAHLVEQVVVEFDDDDATRAVAEILDVAKRCGSIAIGPGLGLSETLGTIVRTVIEQTPLPLVVDASGLFHLAKHLDILRGKRAVLTPHAGEFARLSGRGTVQPTERISRLRTFVRENEIVTLLKGQTTLIDDGARIALNTTGTPALATAGTGDVLTGMIATLLSQGLAPFDAAALAAHWHGRAAQHASQARPIGVIAGDLPDSLAAAASERERSTPLRVF